MDNLASERRRHSRADESVCAWLQFPRDGAVYSTLTKDLGSHGAQFCAARRVSVSERVAICFQLPFTNIGCEAKVCWVKQVSGGESSFGVRFVNLTDCERDYLERFVVKTRVA